MSRSAPMGLIADLVNDLAEMHRAAAINLNMWPSASALILWYELAKAEDAREALAKPPQAEVDSTAGSDEQEGQQA